MSKIFCLLGKSGSGKDTIFKILIKDKTLNLKPIIPYTTRPKREEETNGLEYHFIDVDKLNRYKINGKIIELREYNTINGIWYYSTIDDGNVDMSSNDYLIITTLDAYINLQKYYGKDKVLPIYMGIDDGVRLERALQREMKEENPNYSELCRRFLADEIDFSEDKLKAAGIKRIYYNNKIIECIDDIKRYIYNNTINNIM